MNIAFAALVIVILTIPGALFLAVYKAGPHGIPSSSLNFQQYLASYVVSSVLLHLLSTFLSTTVTGLEVRYQTLTSILTGWRPTPQEFTEISDSLVGPFGATLWYIVISSLLGVILAMLCRRIVRYYYLDLIFSFIRPHSEWHYLFSGEVDAIKAAINGGSLINRWKLITEILQREVDTTAIAVVIEQGGEAQLYWGELYDWYANGDKLERIILRTAQRRELECDQKEGEKEETPIESKRFYPIKGDLLVIEAQDISTLNIYYYRQPVQP